MLASSRLVARSLFTIPRASAGTCIRIPNRLNEFLTLFNLAGAWSALRSYATTDNASGSRFRQRGLTEHNLPQLDKVDSILDFPEGTLKTEGKPTDQTLQQSKLFPPSRPADVVMNANVDVIDTPLTPAEQNQLMKLALVVKRVVNMNGKGKQPSMYALVVVGNGKGLAGYGEGKDDEASRAIQKATNRAIRNLRYFHRYDDRTIAMDIEHKFHAVKLELRSRPPGISYLQHFDILSVYNVK